MRLLSGYFALLALVAASCRGSGGTTAAPSPAAQPLAVYAAQRLILTPAGFVRPDTSAWSRQASITPRTLDSVLTKALTDRGLAQQWILPDALVEAFRRNRTYATDPYRLALQPLRASAFVTAERYAEPLSSQLRTMIALHEEGRYVLIPVELWFEPVGTAARGMLKVALLDPRFAHANWVGTVQGTAESTPAAALTSVATRVADLFVAP